MRAPIGDKSAIEFSRGFYEAIASGKSYKFAFSEGRRCVQAVASSDSDLPVLVTRETLSKFPLQPRGIRTEEYDRWYHELNKGKLEVVLHPSASVEINILTRILNQVLQEKQFSQTIAGNAEVVLSELIINVARHVKDSQAVVGLEINTRHLPLVVVSVGDQGKGYDLWETVKQQYLLMKSNSPEHGLGRICRLSDHVLPIGPSESNPFFTMYCTLFDIPWPGSICDEYSWCAKVILDYSSPPSVWFGKNRYPLWWHYSDPQMWIKEWAILGTLDCALDNDIPQILDIYLEHVAVSYLPYLFYEIRGQGFTETLEQRSSQETITETLETYLVEYFTNKKVLLYASKGANIRQLRTLSKKYGLGLYVSEEACRRKLGALDKEVHDSK